MTAFDAGAPRLLDLGWWPIPVRGKSQPATGTTGYEGTVTVEKVRAWLGVDLTERARLGRGVGLDNLGIRHQLTLAIDVDQGYGDKDGVTQLAAYAAKRNLPPLPATWSSTARGDASPSRQYLYRIPEDVRFQTKPCPSVELCCWHHRFTACAPTVHPGTGTPYTWYRPGQPGVPPTWGEPTEAWPASDNLADLPAEWFAALRGGVANADRSAATIALPELLATFPDGPADPLICFLIEKWSDEAVHVGHDEFKNAAIHALLLGREGHPGVPRLLALLVERFTSYLGVARADVAVAEAKSLLEACADIAQQKPISSDAAPAASPVAADPVDDGTLAAFLNTFTEPGTARYATNRQTWLAEALHRHRHTRDEQFRYHAVKAFDEVIRGRYSARAAVELLTTEHTRAGLVENLDDALRACLATALSNLEGATR